MNPLDNELRGPDYELPEELFRLFIGALPDAVTIMTNDMIYDCNSAAERLFRGERHQLCGQTCKNVFPEFQPDGQVSIDILREKIHEVLRDGKGDCQLVSQQLDGSIFRAEMTMSPMRMSGFPFILCSWRDITHGKLAGSASAAIVDKISDAIVMIDCNGLISHWNPAAELVLGYRSTEVTGKPLQTILLPERYQMAHAAAFSLFTQKGHIAHKSVELTAVRKDGREIPIELSLSADRNNKGWCAIGIIRDISERRRVEEEREQTLRKLIGDKQRAEEASRAKSNFLSMMSHEIRTPMNGIIGMTNLLIDTHLTTEQRDYTEIVRKSGENLLDLINDILDFSKIEAGKLDLDVQPFDLYTLMWDAAELSSLRAAEKGLELLCIVDPTIPKMVLGDSCRVRQIIINLVGNAIKFTNSGEIIITVSLKEERDEHVSLQFEVKDTGIGMRADRLKAIFEPFIQAEGATTRKFGGTGLGLAICKQLAESMGGKIFVTSEYEKGSTFSVTISLAKQPGHGPADDSARGNVPTELSGTRVLVIDTNSIHRAYLMTLLSQWGCVPEAAGDVESALALLGESARSNTPFHIALIDQKVRGFDCLELGQRIKSDVLANSTSLILMTALGQRVDAELLLESGVAVQMIKPVRHTKLINSISHVLRKSCTPATIKMSPSEQVGQSGSALYSAHILLAEDNVINQKVAVKTLQNLGYRVDVAANGLEALSALESTHYDIVLMDCLMPEMDGFEATARIRDVRTNVRNHAVPIIAMTANAMKEDRDNCLRAGMDDYLSKPVKKEALATILNKWMLKF